MVSRNMRELEIGEEGESVRIWISNGNILGTDMNFSPTTIYHELSEHVGNIPTLSCIGGSDKALIAKYMMTNWV